MHALLHGETGVAERLVLGNRFDRGSLEERVVHTTRDLGTLRRLELGLDVDKVSFECRVCPWLQLALGGAKGPDDDDDDGVNLTRPCSATGQG